MADTVSQARVDLGTVVAVIAPLFVFVPQLVHPRKIMGIIAQGEHATSQTTLRWTMFLSSS